MHSFMTKLGHADLGQHQFDNHESGHDEFGNDCISRSSSIPLSFLLVLQFDLCLYSDVAGSGEQMKLLVLRAGYIE